MGHGTLPDLSVALSLDEKSQIAAGTLTGGAPSALEPFVFYGAPKRNVSFKNEYDSDDDSNISAASSLVYAIINVSVTNRWQRGIRSGLSSLRPTTALIVTC